jgi:hypothetical protein
MGTAENREPTRLAAWIAYDGLAREITDVQNKIGGLGKRLSEWRMMDGECGLWSADERLTIHAALDAFEAAQRALDVVYGEVTKGSAA